MLTGMTARVRQFILEEMAFLGVTPETEVLEVHWRILQQARMLAVAGAIGRPPGSAQTSPSPRPEAIALDPSLVSLVAKSLDTLSLDTLSLDDIRRLCRLLSGLVAEEGIVALDRAAQQAVTPFLIEGLRLASDGTEPALLKDLLLTRARTLVRILSTRMDMIVEGSAAIQAGDNPAIVAHKVSSCYAVDTHESHATALGSVEPLQAYLKAHPVSSADLDELAMVLTDLAHVSRRQGEDGLQQMVEHIDDPFLADGLRLILDGGRCQRLKEKQAPLCAEVGLRLRLFTAGLTAICEGKKENDLETALTANWVTADFDARNA